MSQIVGKWIADGAITSEKLNSIDTFNVGGLLVDATFASGSIGIGTIAPLDKIHVRSTASKAGIRLDLDDGVTGRAYQITSGLPGYPKNFIIKDLDAGLERLVINENGNIGVNIAVPTDMLTLRADSTESALRLDLDDGMVGRAYKLVSDIGGNFKIIDMDTATTRFQITPTGDSTITGDFVAAGNIIANNDVLVSGNVGAGTNSPDDELHAYRGSAGTVVSHASAVFTVESNADESIQMLVPNTASQKILFGDVDDNSRFYVKYDHNTDIFSVNSDTTSTGLSVIAPMSGTGRIFSYLNLGNVSGNPVATFFTYPQYTVGMLLVPAATYIGSLLNGGTLNFLYLGNVMATVDSNGFNSQKDILVGVGTEGGNLSVYEGGSGENGALNVARDATVGYSMRVGNSGPGNLYVSGNVGVGTDPTASIHVYNATDAKILLQNDSGLGQGSRLYITEGSDIQAEFATNTGKFTGPYLNVGSTSGSSRPVNLRSDGTTIIAIDVNGVSAYGVMGVISSTISSGINITAPMTAGGYYPYLSLTEYGGSERFHVRAQLPAMGSPYVELGATVDSGSLYLMGDGTVSAVVGGGYLGADSLNVTGDATVGGVLRVGDSGKVDVVNAYTTSGITVSAPLTPGDASSYITLSEYSGADHFHIRSICSGGGTKYSELGTLTGGEKLYLMSDGSISATLAPDSFLISRDATVGGAMKIGEYGLGGLLVQNDYTSSEISIITASILDTTTASLYLGNYSGNIVSYLRAYKPSMLTVRTVFGTVQGNLYLEAEGFNAMTISSTDVDVFTSSFNCNNDATIDKGLWAHDSLTVGTGLNTPRVVFNGLPTSSAGLPSGALYRDNTNIAIVP